MGPRSAAVMAARRGRVVAVPDGEACVLVAVGEGIVVVAVGWATVATRARFEVVGVERPCRGVGTLAARHGMRGTEDVVCDPGARPWNLVADLSR